MNILYFLVISNYLSYILMQSLCNPYIFSFRNSYCPSSSYMKYRKVYEIQLLCSLQVVLVAYYIEN